MQVAIIDAKECKRLIPLIYPKKISFSSGMKILTPDSIAIHENAKRMWGM